MALPYPELWLCPNLLGVPGLTDALLCFILESGPTDETYHVSIQYELNSMINEQYPSTTTFKGTKSFPS